MSKKRSDSPLPTKEEQRGQEFWIGVSHQIKERRDHQWGTRLPLPHHTLTFRAGVPAEGLWSIFSKAPTPQLSPRQKACPGAGAGPRGSSGSDARHHHSSLYGNVSWVQGTGVGLDHRKPAYAVALSKPFVRLCQ